jgi:putative oxidoreductase
LAHRRTSDAHRGPTLKAFNLILRLILGGVFIAAGALKIWEPTAFAADIANYRLLPHEAVNLLAITLPWIEIAAGLFLVCGIWRRASALVITILMIVFLAAIGQALARGLDIRCGCFGTVEARKVGVLSLGQDILMFVVAAWLAWREKD